jgi:hypothetical protein
MLVFPIDVDVALSFSEAHLVLGHTNNEAEGSLRARNIRRERIVHFRILIPLFPTCSILFLSFHLLL